MEKYKAVSENVKKDNHEIEPTSSLNLNEEVLKKLQNRGGGFRVEKIIRTSPDKEASTNESYSLVHIPFTEKLPATLPKGYGFSGGVARNAALQALGHDVMPPRDIDIVAITDAHPDTTPAIRDELAKKYMQDDYARGHGVRIESLAEYFSTRDFVLNEVLLLDDELITTPEALNDLEKKLVQPTQYESDSWRSYTFEEEGLHPKLVWKAVLLSEELKMMYGHGDMSGIKEWQWDYKGMPLFFLALALDKAYQKGDALATRFYTKLLELGTVSSSYTKESILAHSPRDLALQISYKMQERGDPFCFQNISNIENNFAQTENTDETIYERYRKLADTYTGSKYKDIENEY